MAERAASGDPYSLRWCGRDAPAVVLQTEYDVDPPLYVGFEPSVLRTYAGALARCWSLLGVTKGDRIAVFDYGTSPLSYLASSLFTPYLGRGAAEILGCLPICNDGTANMAPRAVEILRFVRPRVMFVRPECLHPLATEISRKRLSYADCSSALVVAQNEEILSREDQAGYEDIFGVPVYRLLRIDIAMFLAVECPHCRLLHSPHDLYFLENGGEPSGNFRKDPLLVTNWFARSLPTLRYLSRARGTVVSSGCPLRPRDQRIAA
ncbi:MAG TPA: hypothetical protein VNN77_15140 [candidate division Zixibacteria bacterium]|nr:hypothetical protein [candidate division Zixibacteria bacterium]